MAEAVANTITGAGQLMVEAGTGTGKTFAYLVPALASGKRVIISTGSKALQERLYNRDLPTLLAAMDYNHPVALLKGRANYLCLHRLDQLLATSHLQEARVLADLVRVKTYSINATSGDVAEIPELLEQTPILPHVTSTNDNCLGRECPRYDDCYLVRARRKAMDAQLVVINHHLFFADMVVKDTGFAELIPDADVYILMRPINYRILPAAISASLSSRQLLDVAHEILLAQRAEAADMAQLARSADALELACREQRLAFGIEPSRGNLRDWVGNPLFDRTLQRLKDALRLYYDVLKLALGRGERLDHCFERLVEYQGKLERLLQTEQSGAAYWFDTTRIHFSFNVTPLSIADRFNSEVMRAGCSRYLPRPP